MHIGRNIAAIREIKGWKQRTLAAKMGVSTQQCSKIEQSETLTDNMLARVAAALEVEPEHINLTRRISLSTTSMASTTSLSTTSSTTP